jgi:hypothetical protein
MKYILAFIFAVGVGLFVINIDNRMITNFVLAFSLSSTFLRYWDLFENL